MDSPRQSPDEHEMRLIGFTSVIACTRPEKGSRGLMIQCHEITFRQSRTRQPERTLMACPLTAFLFCQGTKELQAPVPIGDGDLNRMA